MRTANYGEWIESVAAGVDIGIVPDIAEHRSTHPELPSIPMEGAPPVTVRLVLAPRLARGIREEFLHAARPHKSSPA